MSVTIISAAINGRNQITFQYNLGNSPGPRLVEPYMVGYNQAGHLALSAWFLGGNSESQEGQGWREYLLDGMSNITNDSHHRDRITIQPGGRCFVVFNAPFNLFRRPVASFHPFRLARTPSFGQKSPYDPTVPRRSLWAPSSTKER